MTELTLDSPPNSWDVFISYASEDRYTVAIPLAEALRTAGLRVWFDVFELKLGDSLTDSINKGLAQSAFGIVILSPNFFAKRWPRRELSGLFSRAMQRAGTLILPVWYKITASDVANEWPLIADLLAVRWEDGADSVVQQIIEVVRPAVGKDVSKSATRAFAEIRRFLASNSSDISQLDSLRRTYTPELIHDALTAIAFNHDHETHLRLRALRTLVAAEGLEAQRWDQLLIEQNTDFIRGLIEILTDQPVLLTEEQIRLLLENERLPRITSGLGEMVRHLIQRNNHLTTSVFLPAAKHSHWQIKYDCVCNIIKIDDKDTIQTLAAFSAMSYWKARGRIVDYLRARIEQRRLSDAEEELTKSILTQIITDGKTEPRTPTMRKAREALAFLRSEPLPNNIDGQSSHKYEIHINHATGLAIGDGATVNMRSVDENDEDAETGNANSAPN